MTLPAHFVDGALSTLPWQLSGPLREVAIKRFGRQGHAKTIAVMAFLGFVVLLFVLLLSASVFVTDDVRAESARRVSLNSTGVARGAPQGSRLPICNNRWGRAWNRTLANGTSVRPPPGAPGELTVVDLALLTSLTYAFDNFETDFDTWFVRGDPAGRWRLANRENQGNSSAFLTFESEPHGVHVVAIRGTTTGRDALADLDIWGEATALRALVTLLPGGAFMDDAVIAWLTGALASFADLTRPPSEIRAYWRDPAEYVSAKLANRDFRARFPHTYVVGHSLGGGIAKIVAAMTGAESVTFEPPGTLYARSKFGLSRADLMARTLTFALDRDPIAARSDRQAAGIQWAHCPDSLPPPACHSLAGIAKMLITDCGDRVVPARDLRANPAWTDGVQRGLTPPRVFT